MTTVTKTSETDQIKIAVKLLRDVSNKVGHADGWNIDMGRKSVEIWSITITGKATGKTIWGHENPHTIRAEKVSGTIGYRIADAYVSQYIYDMMMALATEAEAALPKSEEQATLEAAETAKQNAPVVNYEPKHGENGYCRKCNSYCYGDCEAN